MAEATQPPPAIVLALQALSDLEHLEAARPGSGDRKQSAVLTGVVVGGVGKICHRICDQGGRARAKV